MKKIASLSTLFYVFLLGITVESNPQSGNSPLWTVVVTTIDTFRAFVIPATFDGPTR